MKKSIDDFTDAELAKMVRDSCYLRGESFGGEHNRFLLIMAVPYGPVDEVEDVAEAIEAFAKLFDCSDWFERTLQIYDHQDGRYFQAAYEDVTVTEEGEV